MVQERFEFDPYTLLQRDFQTIYVIYPSPLSLPIAFKMGSFRYFEPSLAGIFFKPNSEIRIYHFFYFNFLLTSKTLWGPILDLQED